MLVLGDDELTVDFVAQLAHVRNDADKAVALAEAAERTDGLRQRLLIERAESLIDTLTFPFRGGAGTLAG